MAAVVGVTETPNDEDMFSEKAGRVEVGWRELLPWVAIDLDLIGRADHNDVIVNVEVWVVSILVLSTDIDDAAVRQFRASLAHSVKCPDWPIVSVEWHLEQITCTVW